MPLRIHGLATSESTHSLGRTVTGSVYPKEGGGLRDPTEGAAWLVMNSLPKFPAGTDDTTSEAMVGPVYGKESFDNDVVYGTLQDGLPLKPYPFLFVGKVWDLVAAEPTARIKWTATWNGEPIRIAEEGRDFLAPRPNDTGWSAEAQSLGVPPTFLPPEGAPTVGGFDEAAEAPECLGRPIVAACRRYCFVYPDLPVGSSRAAWDETTYGNLVDDPLPFYADPDENIIPLGVLRPQFLYDDGADWGDMPLNPRRSVFPADAGPRCTEGVLELFCDVYASDSEEATLLVSRKLTLHVGSAEPGGAERVQVSVFTLTLPVDVDSASSDDYYNVHDVTGPMHSITMKQYLLPLGYEYLLSGTPEFPQQSGWDAVLTPANELPPDVLFPEDMDPVVWPTLLLEVEGYYGSNMSGVIEPDSGDATLWTLTSDMSINGYDDITSYPQTVFYTSFKTSGAHGKIYGPAQFTVDTAGTFDDMVAPFAIARVIYEGGSP